MVISPQARPWLPLLRIDTARRILQTVAKLKAQASFRVLLLEANSQGMITDHRTLRRYLDLLVQSGLLKVREKDVGPVNPQQLHTPAGSKAPLYTI